MCGIVGYIGEQDAYPLLINGLSLLEYLKDVSATKSPSAKKWTG